MNLIILILVVVIIVAGSIQWCERRVKSGGMSCGMGLRDITRREFDTLIDNRKFSELRSWVSTPYLSQFFAGKYGELETCIFSIAIGRYSPTTLAVLLTSINLALPSFIIRPKSMSQEAGDMLGLRQHHPAIPKALIDKFDVSSEDDDRFAAMLTPAIISLFLDNEGTSVEYHSGALLIGTSLLNRPENYVPAVQRAHAFAQQLGKEVAATD